MIEKIGKKSSELQNALNPCDKCGKPEIFGSGLYESGYNLALSDLREELLGKQKEK